MQYLGISHEMLRVDSLDKKKTFAMKRCSVQHTETAAKERPTECQPSERASFSRSRDFDRPIDAMMNWARAGRRLASTPNRPRTPKRCDLFASRFQRALSRCSKKKIKSKKKNDLVIFRFIERYQALFRPFFFASNLCHQTLKLNIFHSNWTLYETVERQPLINRLI